MPEQNVSPKAVVSPDKRFPVLETLISATHPQHVCEHVESMISNRRKAYINVCTVHTVLEAHDQPSLAAIINKASLAVPDGMPLVWLGQRAFPEAGVQRCYGPDLMLSLCEAGVPKGWRHCLYGASESVINRLEEKLTQRFPGIQIVERIAPPFRPLTERERQTTIARINQAAPDIVWVGLGTPKQDQWIGDFREPLEAPVLIAVGAAFDFHAGQLVQAPKWMQRCGLEWLFRLIMEPRRLWRRYLIGNPRFLWLLWRKKRLNT